MFAVIDYSLSAASPCHHSQEPASAGLIPMDDLGKMFCVARLPRRQSVMVGRACLVFVSPSCVLRREAGALPVVYELELYSV